jgi:gliding motility-associated-like protein
MKNYGLTLFILIALTLCFQTFHAQIILISNGTISACGGTLQDDGGGGSYTDQGYTLTICPDNPGDVVQLSFSAFALQTSPNPNNSDYLSIYDGDTSGAPSLGDYAGSSLQGLPVTGTVNNVTGCLTIVFDPNGAANAGSPGFEAEISCTTPCAPPTATSAIVDPLPLGDVQTVSLCLNTPVSFSGAGSFAEPGFTLAQYHWNFDDGSIDSTSGSNVQHAFSEPGEYIVTLTVEDNNGCTSLNVLPLQVLVSTIPQFPGIGLIPTEYCFGENIILDAGEVVNTTWTALPPQVVSGVSYLADGAGFSYTSSLVFDFFEPDALLTDCSDLLNIFVNMEHSYMGDLGISIICPDGTTVDMVEWGVNGGGGTFLGEAVDDENTTPGIGYDYYWTPDASNGTWGANATGGVTSLPAGVYESQQDLCALVGCPLNGEWTFSVTDNLGQDNGYIFQWGVGFDPSLYPGVTSFTPIIGVDSDSSYWEGPFIEGLDANSDIATLVPTGPGAYEYTYTTINNFGCQFDTSITINVNQALLVTAGPDLLYSCDPIELQGSLVGLPVPTCSNNAGIFTYCYSDNETFTWTFCPDNPGDGTLMTFAFLDGIAENSFDNFTIYDGNSTSSPVIQANVTGTLTGLSWIATNSTGCITISFSADVSVSCGSGSFNEIQYEVSCGNGGPPYTWNWTPAEFLDDATNQTPNVVYVPTTTAFLLTGFPVGHPDCESTDVVVVNVDPLGDPGLNAEITICSNDEPFDMFNELGGTPVTNGDWLGPNNLPMSVGLFDPQINTPGDYSYSVDYGDCEAHAVLTIHMALPTEIEIVDDTTICYNSEMSLRLLNLDNGQTPFSYSWTYDGQIIGNSEQINYTSQLSGSACLTVTDACGYEVTECSQVIVTPDVPIEFEADTVLTCWPEAFTLHNLVDSNLFYNSIWDIEDGTTVLGQNDVTHIFAQPGAYDVVLTLTNGIGCVYSQIKSNYLHSIAPPTAGWVADPMTTDALNTEIHFSNASAESVVSYSWSFGEEGANGTSFEENPVVTFPIGVSGEYPVELTVMDSNNCVGFISGMVVINEFFQYYIPNSFTPNGDGINDVFKVEGSDIDASRFELIIFNRWGDVLFESKDPSQPWLGGAKNEAYFVDNGIYPFRAVVVSKSTGEKKEIGGSITIMR